MLFTIISYIYSTYYSQKEAGNDQRFNYPSHYRIGLFFANIGDFWTDLMFSCVLYLQKFNILSKFASFFTLFPFVLQLIIAIKFVIKWKYSKDSNKDKSKRLINYLDKHHISIYLLSIVSGFYNTIDLLESEIFYLKFFKFSLKSNEYDELRPYRFFNIILFENVPQFSIQIIYLLFVSKSNNLYKASTIVFISMMFSVLALIFGFIKEISRQLHQKKDNEKKKNFLYISKINGILTIKSNDLNYYHNFCHSRISKCLRNCLIECDKHLLNNDFDTFNIETYHVKDERMTSKQIQVYFEIDLWHNNIKLRKFSDNVHQLGQPGTPNTQKMIQVKKKR